MEIRKVSLPEVSGGLYLSRMPGRFEAFEEALKAILGRSIAKVVCLASDEELATCSADYFEAIQERALAWEQVSLPMPDSGTSPDLRTTLGTIEEIVGSLKRGDNVLIHCVGGIGRTGTLAICVLVGLGLDILEASVRVADAEAGPESGAQEQLIDKVYRLRL